MHQIVTQIDIAASSERVWSILMDFPAYMRVLHESTQK